MRKLISRTALAMAMAAISTVASAQVKVALIDPMSGPFAFSGESAVRGFNEAAAVVNAQGGILGQQLEIVTLDNKGSPQESLIAFKAATDQGIRYITQGQGSGAAHALIEAVNKWNSRNPDKTVLFLNYAAVDPTLTEEKCNFWHFRFDANTNQKMQVITNALAADASVKKVFILGQDYAHGHQVAAAATEMLGKKRPDIQIVGSELHPIGRVKDFGPYVAKIKAAGADAVITGNWGVDLNLFVRAAKDAGLDARIYTFYAGTPGGPAAMGESGENRVFQVSEWHMNIEPNKTRQYAMDYVAKYPGHEFSALRIVTELGMLAKAMNEAKSTDPKTVALKLENMRFAGDTGEVWMRKADHQLMQPMFLSMFAKKNDSDVRYEAERTGYGWKPVGAFTAADMELPTACSMTRP